MADRSGAAVNGCDVQYTADVAATFKGGKSWRRRFAMRFKIGVRRKTNAKNKTWTATEPILIRYWVGLRKRLQLEAPPDALPDVPLDVEPEPEDVNPPAEEEEVEGDEDPLDDDDDPEEEDDLVAFVACMPQGYKVAMAPPKEQLECRAVHANELVGRLILFNWAAVGWCQGVITHSNTDGRAKVKVGDQNMMCNFVATYSDESEAKHSLSLDDYGEIDNLRVDGRWVLLERAS